VKRGLNLNQGLQYEKKVKEYLLEHLDHFVIHKLRNNRQLTKTYLEELEEMLVKIGGEDGIKLMKGLLERIEAPSLIYFIRTLVGMDRTSAQASFSEFLSDRSLNTSQIRFIEMIIEQLTARGVMEPSALYEAPFSNLHAGGPEALFVNKDNVIDGIFDALKSVQPQEDKKVT